MRLRLGASAVVLAAVTLLAFFAPGFADSIVVDLPAVDTEARVSTAAQAEDGRAGIDIPGFSTCGPPGSPALPCKLIYVILPPDAEPESVGVIPKSCLTAEVSGTYDVAPVPQVVPMDEPETSSSPVRDPAVYGRDAFYPAQQIRVREVGMLRTRKVAVVEYWPYGYSPVTGALRKVSSRQCAIYFARQPGCQAIAGDPIADKMSEALLGESSSGEGYASGEATLPGYAIVTTNAVASASVRLKEFIDLLELRGFAVTVATENDWGGGVGDTAANNIRNWLAANYLRLGTEYVLLIGDPNPSAGGVPMKMLWPRYNQSSLREAPSDYFYSDLTGNWDLDGDGACGEEPDDFGKGGIDRIPDVFVGRIPYRGSIEDLDAILEKTVRYESSDLGDWGHRILLPMRALDQYTPGYHLGEQIRCDIGEPAGLAPFRFYDSDYGLDPPPDCWPCAPQAVLAEWRRGAGLVFWLTHGGATEAGGVMTTDWCPRLDDSRPAIVYQGSCSNGTPEEPDNLAHSLLRYGAVTTVAASRSAWYFIGERDFTCTDSVGSLGSRYASNLAVGAEPCAQALMHSKLGVPMYIWPNHLVLNLYGDPSLVYNHPAPGAVAGRVRTIGGGPVGDAVVRMADGAAQARSDADGSFLLRLPAAGQCDLTVSAEGFYPQRFHSVPVTAGKRTSLDITLVGASPGTLRGRILDAYGAPVAEAQVVLEPDGRQSRSAQDGSYLFDGVPPGSHALIVSKPPLAQEIAPDCLVTEGQVTEVSVSLNSRSGNVVKNGSFEHTLPDGSAQYWRDSSDAECQGSVSVATDCRRYGIASQKMSMPAAGGDRTAGACQTVSVVPGQRYTLVACQRDHCRDGDGKASGDITCRIGYDPTGGADGSARTVEWHEFDPTNDVWHTLVQQVTPYSTVMTVFLEARRKHGSGGDDAAAWFDGISLTGPVPAPKVPIVHALVRCISAGEAVRARWSCNDPEVVGYECAVSSTCDESGILPGGGWIGVDMTTSTARSGLPLAEGDVVRFLVRSVDGLGILSGVGASEPIRVVRDASSLSEASALADGTWVRVEGAVVTRMGHGPECFVQDADRVCGARVIGDWTSIPYLLPGTQVEIVGRVAHEGPLTVLRDAELAPSLASAAPGPLAMLCRSLCIAEARRGGADPMALLVTVAGRVTGSETESFTLHDGSTAEYLRVDCFHSAAPPPAGSFVRVTGIALPGAVAAFRQEDIDVVLAN